MSNPPFLSHGKNKRWWLATFWAFIMLTIFTSNATTVEDFSKHARYYNIKISPDGKHFAALVNANGGKNLLFLDSTTFKVIFAVKSNSQNQPAAYYWANNERVVIQIEQLNGAFAQPLNYGEIYAINYDGSRGKMIYGYRSKLGFGTTIGGVKSAGILLDMLEGDDKHVLVTKSIFSFRSDTIAKVERLNIYNGRTKRVKSAPAPYSSFLTDNNGVPRFVVSTDENADTKLFYRTNEEDKWHPFGEEFTGIFEPITFGKDNNTIYAFKAINGESEGLYQYNLTTQKETLLYRNEKVSPTSVVKSDLNNVFGIRIDDGYPKYIYLDKNNQDSKLHRSLFKTFKGDNVHITSKSDDGTKMVILTAGDKNSGSFYLYDSVKNKLQFLVKKQSWIKPDQLAAVKPFNITTKDGLTLGGYITLPQNKDKNLPTVVLPHGGPHARDYWGYNPQVQMLANAGYAVVQINFRGSTGYGEDFMHAGYQQWGDQVQEDILLAAKYSIEQGYSDKNKVCIFGTSFGGYSALQSAIRTPDFYKCAIGYAGVYDLPMLYEEGDVKTFKFGGAYLDKTLGTDVAKQKAFSPVYHVDKLKAPVLLIHGEDDNRAPIEHAEKLRDALEKSNHPFEWLVKNKEGHGFYDEKNILEANKKILSFLQKHIGS